MVRAISPISSPRSRPLTVTSKFPSASPIMVLVMSAIGRVTVTRTMMKAKAAAMPTPSTVSARSVVSIVP